MIMRNLTLLPSWLRFLMIFLLAMGILFRFVNLEGKIYSHDEIYTSLRISGYTVDEVKQEIFNDRVISQESFTKFQQPHREKGFSSIIMSLATEDLQYPPVYYLIARLWVQIFGNTVTVIRSLSAVISLLVFPAIYWLCRELFHVPFTVPGFAIALMAISPIHILYAQQASPDILWLVTIILCHAALLRSLRLETKSEQELATAKQNPDSLTTWGIYVLTLTFSLYTSCWTVFVALAHFIYVMLIHRFEITVTVRAYLFALSLVFFAFLPWMMIVLGNFFEFVLSGNMLKEETSLMTVISLTLMQISRIFFDLNFRCTNPVVYLVVNIFIILVGYAIYWLWRTTNYKTWLFIVMLILVPLLPIMLPNLFSQAIKKNLAAYLIPVYLGIQLAVAYLLAIQIYNGNVSRRRLWQMIFLLLVICGLVSSRVSYEYNSWWNQGISANNVQFAEMINQTKSPLLISDAQANNYVNVFSLSYLLQPKVRFILVNNQQIPPITQNFTDIFLLNPPDTWMQQLESKYQSTSKIVYGRMIMSQRLVWFSLSP
jgi:uncharacterized membrane protein